MGSERARRWYLNRRKALKKMYWENNDGSNILLPNGFREYPHDIYNTFLRLIDGDGKIIDLGCGNGLLLKHIVTRSRYNLIPYGIDFIEESIKQAKELIFPEYHDNFSVANIADVDLGESLYDFILFDPTHVHVDDHLRVLDKVLKACRPGGKVIFYIYKDMLRILKIAKIIPLLNRVIQIKVYRYPRWVGDLLPQYVRNRLTRIDHRDVSIGVYRCH
ncbi:MAG: class I SAM-dependent methyltransferase [Desulfurococcales archaeon]|nr:class I SAM-dependent methyltransferase [Desulfurococcales archaeon]